MVEDNSEDVFMHLANETGYRICCCAEDSKEDRDLRFFSTVLDPNNPSNYLQCTQDGYMYYQSGEKRQKLEIQFRRFTSDVTSQIESGRRVPYHWDKVSLIAGRPGDVLFLLGVSKTLLYTSLPGSSSAIANYSSDGSIGFAHGTPVVEVISHYTRITSLSVSTLGELVVTGDEQGYIKMLYIRRQEKNKRQRVKYDFADASDAERGIKTHQGPIFALQWIDTSFDNMKYLATASSDRCVRIWRVNYGQSSGITIEPVISLDTVTADMLCLSSLCNDVNYMYLAASTNLGSIYIWNLDVLRLHAMVSDTPAEDDGSYIHTIIHSSTFPVVHLNLHHSDDDIVIVSGDTKGYIRIHTSTASAINHMKSQAHFTSPVIAITCHLKEFSRQRLLRSFSLRNDPSVEISDNMTVFTLSGGIHTFSLASVLRVEHTPDESHMFVSPSSPASAESHEQKPNPEENIDDPIESDDEIPRSEPPTPATTTEKSPIISTPTLQLSENSNSVEPKKQSPMRRKSNMSTIISATSSAVAPPPPPPASAPISPPKTPSKSTSVPRAVSPKKASFVGVPPPTSHLPPPVSEFSAATLNSIKHKIQEIHDDELSVQTAETSSTERHKIANVTVNHERNTERYTDLPSLQALEQQAKPRKPVIDEKWLRRKHEFALTDEAMAVLLPPQPVVKLSVKHTSTPNNTSSDDSYCPLKARLDSKGIHHEFFFEVHADEVFGKKDPSKDIRNWDKEIDKLCKPSFLF